MAVGIKYHGYKIFLHPLVHLMNIPCSCIHMAGWWTGDFYYSHKKTGCYLTENRILLTSQLANKEPVLGGEGIVQILICTNTT